MIDWEALEKRRQAGLLKPGDVAGTCVVCNGSLYIGTSGMYIARHDCLSSVIAGREAADRNADENHFDPSRDLPYGSRLADGFALLADDEQEDD